jgi:subtilisin family serine protease
MNGKSSRGFFQLRVAASFALFFAGALLAMVAWSKPVIGSTESRPTEIAKIAPEVLAETDSNGSASIVILMAEQADVSAAYSMKDQDARGWFVYNTLTQHAARTQAALRAELDSRGVSYQSFWAANMIVATADQALIESIAARADVGRIDSNRAVRWIEPPELANSSAKSNSPSAPDTTEWGVQNVNAPQVWALGFTGQGIVIGEQDTGVRWTHNALKPKYRGWDGTTADHNYNWHDAIHSGGGICGADTQAPCDDNGHGTHTAGTTVGDDGAGNQVGVAPGAKWIGCRNMDQGNGTPARYTECFQFMMAPTDLAGNNPNPALRAHVLNNSWSCPASEGCTTGAELEAIINNTQAAGIFVVVAATNSGPNCSTVSDPPAIYDASFSVGAYDINNQLASFSSRGPSTYYTPSLLKPNLSAPGVNVRSSTRTSDTSYGNLQGTSMASPHVAGAVALLWSARPALVRDIAATKALLQNTANPTVSVIPQQTCGGTSSSTDIPNNSFGYGRVDVLAAVNASAPTVLGDISSRLFVQSGDNVLIGGFIINGNQDKKVVVRALGPSLSLPNKLADPILELRDSSGRLVQINDNWVNSPNRDAIRDAGLAPANDAESAIIATLPANGNSYTAIVRGANDTTGIGVVEVYDVDGFVDSKLANISTRGLVQTGDNVLIAGTIVAGSSTQKVIVRAIGPSLNIAGKLADPTLELHDANGTVIRADDNWRMGGQEAEIMQTGLAPPNDLESALIETLSSNTNYTAIVRGVNDTTGIAVVEVFALN